MNRELRDARHRTSEQHESRLEALDAIRTRDLHEGAPRERQIAVEPRVEQHAPIHLDPELGVALLLVLRVGLEPQVRAIRMRADEPKSGDALGLRNDEREQARAAVRERVATWSEVRPGVRLGDGLEAGVDQARVRVRDRMERRWRVGEEGEEIVEILVRHDGSMVVAKIADGSCACPAGAHASRGSCVRRGRALVTQI